MEDPFTLVRDEVQKSLAHLQQLFDTWSKLDASRRSGTQPQGEEQLKWAAEEIKSSINTIEWDIQDLEETVKIVEANPQKFKLDAQEVQRRKLFVDQSKSKLESIRRAVTGPVATSASRGAAHAIIPTASATNSNSNSMRPTAVNTRTDPLSQPSIASPATVAPLHGSNAAKSSAFSTAAHQQPYGASSNFSDDLIQTETHQQMAIMNEQDEQMGTVLNTVANLKNMAHTIGNELEDQAFLIDNLEEKVGSTQNRMQSATARLNQIIKAGTADKKSFYLTMCLLGVIVLLIILIVVT